MRQPRSIRFYLSVVFFAFFALVFILGSLGLWRLHDVDLASSDIRGRWLQTTRILGDLNNVTSDFRAAEGRMLLSQTAAEVAASIREIAELDRELERAQNGFAAMRHDNEEAAVFTRFVKTWSAYRATVTRSVDLTGSGDRAEAITLYRSVSRNAFAAATNALDQLTAWNVSQAGKASEEAERAYVDAVWLTCLTMLVAAIMGVIGIVFVKRLMADPLLELTDAMRRLSQQHTDIDISGTNRPDEIGDMARAVVVFRNNAVDLIESRNQLSAHALLLKENLEHEKYLTDLQRNFVTMASHEFRTPLGVIDGHAQRLIKISDRIQPVDIVERARKIRAAVLRMTNLIDDMLVVGRITNDDLQESGHFKPFDLTELVREVCELHREMSFDADIRIDGDGRALILRGSREFLFHVFSNFLSNSIKYSPQAAHVNIQVREAGSDAVVTFEDRGIGIPLADLPHLFSRHFRGSNVSGIVGTGTGLFVARKIVELHKGSVQVESTEGQGSRFTVRLPRSGGEVAQLDASALAFEPRPVADPGAAAAPKAGAPAPGTNAGGG